MLKNTDIPSRDGLDIAFANMFSNPTYAPNYLFYAHMISMCAVKLDNNLPAPAAIGFNIDHYELFINPLEFDKFPLEQQLGVLKHEMLHILNNHVARCEDRDHRAFNYATDCAINQMIDRTHLPDGVIYPDNFPTEDGKPAPKNLSAEQYYELMGTPPKCEDCDGTGESDEDCDSCGGSGQNEDGSECEDCKGKGKKPCDSCGGSGNGEGTLDDHGKWQDSQGDKDLQKDITKNMIEQSVGQTQKSRGNVPGNISDYLSLFTRKSEIGWKKVLRGIVGNKRVDSRRTIMKVDRRFPKREDLKGKTKNRMFNLLVVGDESGSVCNKELSGAIAEVLHICTVTKSDLDYIAIDTQAHAPIKLKKTQRAFKRQACGGTNLNPAIQMAKQHKIDFNAVVVVTDGYLCSSDIDVFRKLKKKVIWLITSEGQIMPEMKSGLMSAYQLKKS